MVKKAPQARRKIGYFGASHDFGSMVLWRIPPLVVDRFETRGGILHRNRIDSLESAHSRPNTASRGISEGIGLIENDSDRFLTDSGTVLDEFRLGDRIIF